MGKHWLAAIALACASALPVHAADLTQTGPQASAAQILAARGAANATVLRLEFAVTGGDHAAPATLRVDLAPDYMLVRDGASAQLFDYRLRRILVLDDAQHRFGNTSLYASADFALVETGNRRFLRQALTNINVPQASDQLDPFWSQSELHVMDPADPALTADMRIAADGVHFTHGNAEVASYTLSPETLSADEKKAFAHLLWQKTALHPSIIAALLRDGHLPQHLSFALPPLRKQTPESWTLNSVTRVAAAYPLTADMAIAPPSQGDAAAKALASVLPLMLDAVAGRAGRGPRSPAQYRAMIDDAVQKKAWFPAVLMALEANEQFGQAPGCANGKPGCASLKDILALAGQDARVGNLFRSLTIEAQDPAQAIALRQALRRDDVVDPYVLDGFIGNTLVGTGHPDQALPLLLAELRGNPYVPGYYKDLGDLFRRSYEQGQAWLCYDLGRALPGAGTAPVIGDVSNLEARDAAAAPQFF